MNEDKDKTTASGLLMGHVYQASEDLLHGVYKTVEDASRFETIFLNISRTLNAIADNLKTHILSQLWSKGDERKLILARVRQTEDLAKVCLLYSNACKDMANTMIAITQKFEKSKNLGGILENFAEKMEEEVELEEEVEEDRETDPGTD